MIKTWQAIRGYAVMVAAFLTCPCHLPITLPLAIGLTSGSALGALISQNQPAVYGLFTVTFIGGLAWGYRLLGQDQAGRSRRCGPGRWRRPGL